MMGRYLDLFDKATINMTASQAVDMEYLEHKNWFDWRLFCKLLGNQKRPSNQVSARYIPLDKETIDEILAYMSSIPAPTGKTAPFVGPTNEVVIHGVARKLLEAYYRPVLDNLLAASGHSRGSKGWNKIKDHYEKTFAISRIYCGPRLP